ncbi:hypothetical protein SUGI_0706170 [Cryptomeria japonica]|nr:hypothetical protein SUGI_0706170 [Cryptomeria japonica]
MGQVFQIVGNSEKLTNWEPSKVENMTSTPGDAWAISVGEDVIVTFVLVQSVMSGRKFKIVGNAPEMGSWDLSKVENMTQTSVDVWASAVTLTKGKAYKYKPYVVDSVSGSTECFAHEERSLTIPEDYSKSNYVETVFYGLECGYACHGTPACSLHGDRIRQVM